MSFIRKIKKNGNIYLAEVENIWKDGKCHQKHIRYVGKEIDGKKIISISLDDLQIKEIKLSGPLLVLNSIANKIRLREYLGEYANEILSMVFAHCLDYRSLNKMTDWFQRTDLNYILNIESLTEKRLINAFDSIEKMDIDKIQNEIFSSVKNILNIKNKSVVYDVTNTYLYGKKCTLGKKGHSKDGKFDNPIIQIGLAVTQDEGIPICHKTFNGNIHDSKTIQAMIGEFKKLKLPKGIIVYDRGVKSTQNIKDFQKINWHTLCGVSLNESLKRLVLKYKDNLIDIKKRTNINDNIFYSEIMNHTNCGINGKLLICFNEKRMKSIRESRYELILDAQKEIKSGHKISGGIKKYLTASGRIRSGKVKNSEMFDGFSLLFSTKNLSPDEMLKMYFDKDIIERAFKKLKGVLGLRPIRHWLHHRVVAHVFICYLSYLLLSLLNHYLKPLGISSTQALCEMETMYKIYLRDKKKKFDFYKNVIISTKQEKIIKLIDESLLKEFG